MSTDLTLADHGLLARVGVLDGIFDRDDVVGRFGVDDVDDRSQRAGFPMTRRTRDHDEPLVMVRGETDSLGEPKRSERWNLVGDQTKAAFVPRALAANIHAEAAQAMQLEREVHRALLG